MKRNQNWLRIAATLACLFCIHAAFAGQPWPANTYHQQPPVMSPLKILFSDEQDVSDVWGKLKFGASPLRPVGPCDNPGFTIKCCVPRPDGSWDVYGCTDPVNPNYDSTNAVWTIHYATTRDGVHYENREVVFTSPPGNWLNAVTIAFSPVRQEFVCVKGVVLPGNGFCHHVYHSRDGRHWTPGANNPVYYDGDNWGQLWSPRLNRFVTATKSFQLVKKHLPDHGTVPYGLVRRVCSIRWSEDGDHWEPSDACLIWGAPNRCCRWTCSSRPTAMIRRIWNSTAVRGLAMATAAFSRC